MDILDDMGVSKLSAKVCFKKVNYSFKPYISTLYCKVNCSNMLVDWLPSVFHIKKMYNVF